MKTLYLECAMGAAGDMLLAALWELLPDREAFLKTLNGLGLPGVAFSAEPAVRCGISGTHMTVTVHGHEEDDHSHHHSTLAEIHHCIDHLPVSQTVRSNAKAVYDRIAQAESRVHGISVEEVHFHEVGAWDAVADVVGVCLAVETLSPDRIVVSPVHVGCGHVHCAHGLLPVPAPAAALLLQDVPVYGGEVRGELCTPTGAALLTHFADDFGPMPLMKVRSVGYGCGKKEFDRANCLRAFWGEMEEKTEQITELACNLDDMTPEAIAFATEELMEAGALDVYTTAIGMKKGRPGILLTCLCSCADEEKMVHLLFRHTTTLGIRKTCHDRFVLSRSIGEVQTPYGVIRVKEAQGFGVCRRKPEYEDAAKAAREHDVSLAEVLAAAEKT